MEKKKLEKIIGMLEPNEFSIDQKTIQNYCTDWRGIYKGKSDLIIFPQYVHTDDGKRVYINQIYDIDNSHRYLHMEVM